MALAFAWTKIGKGSKGQGWSRAIQKSEARARNEDQGPGVKARGQGQGQGPGPGTRTTTRGEEPWSRARTKGQRYSPGTQQYPATPCTGFT